MKSVGTEVDHLRAERFFREQFLQAMGHGRFAGVFLGAFLAERFQPILLEEKPSVVVDFKLGHLQVHGPKVYGQK